MRRTRKIIRPVTEGLIAAFVAVPFGIGGQYLIAQQRQHGRVIGYYNDAEGVSYVLALALFALPALLLSIGAVRRLIAERSLRLLQKSAIGAATGSMLCPAIFYIYAPVVFPHGLGFVWPLLVIMGGVAGLMTALLRRHQSAGGPPGT